MESTTSWGLAVIIARMKHRARKRFGQNFLSDHQVIQRIIQAINPQPQDQILEIGPGQAALTIPLLQTIGALQAIEIDRDLIPLIKKQCAPFGRLQLYQADVLTVDFVQFITNQKKLRLVGNLPYNISTPILFHVLQQRDLIQDMHCMLQKEVAERMAAEPNSKAYGRLSVMLQAVCQVDHFFDIAPGAFKPAPQVDSSFVRLTPLTEQPDIDEAHFSKIVATCFAQRRKTLRNNLKGLIEATQLEAIGIDPGARAETLSINQFCALTNCYTKRIEKSTD